jgi:hypothetical protein
LEQSSRSGAKASITGLTLGYPPSHDPDELVVEAYFNRLEQAPDVRPIPILMIHAANYNSQKIVNRRFDLSPKESPGKREAKGHSESPLR